jgi:hypothetical protein
MYEVNERGLNEREVERGGMGQDVRRPKLKPFRQKISSTPPSVILFTQTFLYYSLSIFFSPTSVTQM